MFQYNPLNTSLLWCIILLSNSLNTSLWQCIMLLSNSLNTSLWQCIMLQSNPWILVDDNVLCYNLIHEYYLMTMHWVRV